MARLRCKIGWHKWEFKDTVNKQIRTLDTLARCTNEDCRYSKWTVVNSEQYRHAPLI